MQTLRVDKEGGLGDKADPQEATRNLSELVRINRGLATNTQRELTVLIAHLTVEIRFTAFNKLKLEILRPTIFTIATFDTTNGKPGKPIIGSASKVSAT